MMYQIVVAKSAARNYEKLDPSRRSAAKQAMRKYLSREPKKTRKTRIKKLTGLKQPQFRLRVGDVRVFYDVNDEKRRVEVLGIVSKSRAQRWLKQKGVGK